MSETPKRRLIDQIGDSPTFVAEGSRLTGDLETPGPLVMCGVVRGDGRIGGLARLARPAALSITVARYGGHCGFFQQLTGPTWLERRILAELGRSSRVTPTYSQAVT